MGHVFNVDIKLHQRQKLFLAFGRLRRALSLCRVILHLLTSANQYQINTRRRNVHSSRVSFTDRKCYVNTLFVSYDDSYPLQYVWRLRRYLSE